MLLERYLEIHAIKIWLKTLKKEKVRRWRWNGLLIQVFRWRGWFGSNGLAPRLIRKNSSLVGGAVEIGSKKIELRVADQIA